MNEWEVREGMERAVGRGGAVVDWGGGGGLSMAPWYVIFLRAVAYLGKAGADGWGLWYILSVLCPGR